MNPSAIRKLIVRVALASVSIGLAGVLWSKYMSTEDLRKIIALCEAIPLEASVGKINSMAANVAGAEVDDRVDGMVIISVGRSDCRLELVSGQFNGQREIANR